MAELEQENKRLLALTQEGQNQASVTTPSDELSEVESLKAQLAAAQERARSLSAQLEGRREESTSPVIKVESSDTLSTVSSLARSTGLPAHKSSASLGLMVRTICHWPRSISD